MWLPPGKAQILPFHVELTITYTAIATKISKHHYMAKKWVVGHLTKYLLRPNEATKDKFLQVNNAIETIYKEQKNKNSPYFGRPIVG